MFEQANIKAQRRPWTLAVSFTFQFAVAGAIILLSLINIDRLPSVVLPVPLPPLPSQPRAVEIVASSRAVSSVRSASEPRIFVEPARIPDRVLTTADPAGSVPAEPEIIGGGLAGTGLPPGLYTGESIVRTGQLPVPPPQRVEEAHAPREPRRVHVGGHVLEAKLVKRVIPEYPRLARDMRIAGAVKLVCVVGRDGAVKDLRVLSGHPLLVSAALAAVRQWVYSPTLLNGEPVEVIAPIDVNFTLSGR